MKILITHGSFSVHVTSLIYSFVAVKAPLILPYPSNRTLKLCRARSLFSILHNKDILLFIYVIYIFSC